MGCHSLYLPDSVAQTSGMRLDDSTDGRDREKRRKNDLAEPAPPPRGAAPVEAPLLGEPPVVLDDPPALFGGGSHTW